MPLRVERLLHSDTTTRLPEPYFHITFDTPDAAAAGATTLRDVFPGAALELDPSDSRNYFMRRGNTIDAFGTSPWALLEVAKVYKAITGKWQLVIQVGPDLTHYGTCQLRANRPIVIEEQTALMNALGLVCELVYEPNHVIPVTAWVYRLHAPVGHVLPDLEQMALALNAVLAPNPYGEENE